MKDYIINDCNVCLNPDTLLEYDDPDITYKIKGMECDNGLWTCGHDFQMYAGVYCGSASPVSPYHNQDTKENCIRKKLEGFKIAVQRELDGMLRFGDMDEYGNKKPCTKGVKACQRAIRWAELQLSPNQQLTFYF